MLKHYYLIMVFLCSLFLLTSCSQSTASGSHSVAGVQPIPLNSGIKVLKIGSRMRIFISSDKCFVTDTSTIKESYQPNLNRLVALLEPYRNVPMTVTGYTDNVLNTKQATMLSRAQADSIVGYLWAHGIPHQQLYAKGKGPECPIAQNDTVSGSAMNRRVEISLWAP